MKTAPAILTYRLYIHCLNKNAPNLASCSFYKHWLILIIFSRQHQHLSQMMCLFNFLCPFTFACFVCFLPRGAMRISAVFAVTRCLSFCPSVTFVYCIQKAEDIVKLLSQSSSAIPLDFSPFSRGAKYTGWGKFAIFDWNRRFETRCSLITVYSWMTLITVLVSKSTKVWAKSS